MTVHTAEPHNALAEALHVADMVQIRVVDRDQDGTPTSYSAIAWHGGSKFYSLTHDTVAGAITRAIELLQAAKGDGPTRIVDVAELTVETGGAS